MRRRLPPRASLGAVFALAAIVWLTGCVPVPVATYPAPRPAPAPPPPPPPLPPPPDRPPRHEARLRVVPSALDFGGTPVNDPVDRELRLRNEGPGSAWVASVAAEGEAFEVAREECSRTELRPGESCAVRVRFAPRRGRTYEGALRIVSPDLDRPVSAPLSGQGLDLRGPSLSVNPGRIDFGRVDGGEDRTQRVEVRNDGRSEVRLRQAYCEGQGFDLVADECSGRSLSPGRACGLTVGFRPQGRGDFEGALVVLAEDRGGGRLAVPLRGRSEGRAEPNLSIEPSALDFGTIAEGRRGMLDVAVRNDGRAGLRVREVVLEGRAFSLGADGCSKITLGPGRSCTATVVFAPESEGGHSGRLTVVSDGRDERRFSVILRGVAEGRRRAEARVNPERLEFGRVEAGGSRTAALEVRNEGRGVLRLEPARAEGPGFAVDRDGCAGRRLEREQACVVQVRYAPERPGVHEGVLSIPSDDVDRRRLAVALRGEGQERRPEVRARPERLDFGAVATGGSRSLVVEVRNEGSDELRLQGARADGPGFSVERDGCEGRRLARGQFCEVQVRFAPDRPGDRKGTLTVGVGPFDGRRVAVPLSGSGERAAAPELGVVPARLDFGDVGLGQDKTLEAEVQNRGTADLRVREAKVEGRGFREDKDGCTQRVLAPGRSCRMVVRFAPEVMGPFEGQLRLVSDDPARPRYDVALVGRSSRGEPPRPPPPPPRPQPPPPGPVGGGDRDGSEPRCRTSRLDALGPDRDKLSVAVDVGPGECAIYSVAVAPGVLYVRVPDGLRFEGEGFETLKSARGRAKKDWFRFASARRIEVRKASEVRFTLTRDRGEGSREPLSVEWSDREERR